MPELTEAMKRELAVAEAVAASRGITLKNADQHIRNLCHAIAKSAMPGVDLLIEEAVQRTLDTAVHGLREGEHKRMAKSYDDGFADGRLGKYMNFYQEVAV